MGRYMLVVLVKRATGFIDPLVEYVVRYAEPAEFVMNLPLRITFDLYKIMHMFYFYIQGEETYRFLMQMDDVSSRLSVNDVGVIGQHHFAVNDRAECACYFCGRATEWCVQYVGGCQYYFGFGVCMPCVLDPWMMFWRGAVKEPR